jgi:hypothetical protein
MSSSVKLLIIFLFISWFNYCSDTLLALMKLCASIYANISSLGGQANVIRSHISVSGIQVHTGAPLPLTVHESSEVTMNK